MTNTLRNCWFIYVAGKSRDLQSAERERATVGFITDLELVLKMFKGEKHERRRLCFQSPY
jgi:hypothetical protein